MESVVRTFLPLGFIGFGGPTGQVGLMERVLVEKFKITSADKFSEQLGICAMLPGSTSLELATSMGRLMSGSALGGLVGGLLFSLPGLMLMLVVGKYAYLAEYISTAVKVEWLYAAAISILIVAVLTMFQKVNKSTLSVIITVIAAGLASTVPYQYLPLIPLGGGLLAALLTSQATLPLGTRLSEEKINMTAAQVALGIFASACLGVYFFAQNTQLMNFFLAGLSFGGTGVLPHLAQTLGRPENFLLLFSAAIVAPGPIYNLAAATGVVVSGSVLYGLAAWSAVTIPGILVLYIVSPLWGILKQKYDPCNRAVLGINASAVGVLAAGTLELFLGTLGLQWTRLFALLVFISLQSIWEVEPVFVVLLGLTGSLLHGILAAI
jgi:chromate transporter